MIEQFIVLHKARFESMGLPSGLHEEISRKILHNIFDASDYVIFGEDETDHDNNGEYDSENNTDTTPLCHVDKIPITFPDKPYSLYSKSDIPAESCAFIVDHMWVTTFPQSRIQLREHKVLQERLASALGINSNSDDSELVDNIWNMIWPHAGCFQRGPDEYTEWYILDEVGLAIQHSVEPNLHCCPLLVQSLSNEPPFSISIVWPAKDISEGELLTRDYTIGVPNSLKQQADISHVKKIWNLAFQYPDSRLMAQVMEFSDSNDAPMSQDYPLHSTIESFSLWNEITRNLNEISISDDPKCTLKVFCDRLDHLNGDLIRRDSRIEMVMDPNIADVLYLIDHTVAMPRSNLVADSQNLVFEYNKTNKIISQYCWNNLIITKEALTNTIRKSHKIIHSIENDSLFPVWFPDSYDLTVLEELNSFLKEFIKTSKSSESGNYWILKKHRGKQSLDYPISNNLSCLLRHCELCDRLASRYISNPLLLQGRKFDLRYHVLIDSFEPLSISRHEIFLIRWANKKYSNSDFEEYQKHFTVMNFLDNDSELMSIRGKGFRQNIHPTEFCSIFDKEYEASSVSWYVDIQPRIDRVIRSLFDYVKIAFNSDKSYEGYHPNSGWSLNQPKNVCPARSMLGVDIIVDDKFQPYVLEIQWAPDTSRAVEIHPMFWEDILSGLYLNKVNNIKTL